MSFRMLKNKIVIINNVSTPKSILGLPQRAQRFSKRTQSIEYQVVQFALIAFSWRALRFLPLFGMDSIIGIECKNE